MVCISICAKLSNICTPLWTLSLGHVIYTAEKKPDYPTITSQYHHEFGAGDVDGWVEGGRDAEAHEDAVAGQGPAGELEPGGGQDGGKEGGTERSGT